MLTMSEREEAAGMALYRLMFRLLKDYRESGKSIRPDLVRYPGRLSLLLEEMDVVVGDCRELLRRKLRGEGDGLEDGADPALAGGDGVAGSHGRTGTPAR